MGVWWRSCFGCLVFCFEVWLVSILYSLTSRFHLYPWRTYFRCLDSLGNRVHLFICIVYWTIATSVVLVRKCKRQRWCNRSKGEKIQLAKGMLPPFQMPCKWSIILILISIPALERSFVGHRNVPPPPFLLNPLWSWYYDACLHPSSVNVSFGHVLLLADL